MAGAADEAARKAKPKIDQVAAMAHKAVDKAADAAAPTAEWLADKGDSLTATQKKAGCRYVQLRVGQSAEIGRLRAARRFPDQPHRSLAEVSA